jgi:hypothetical protein
VFSGSPRIEKVHPLQFGFVRRKLRNQRRYGMPLENPLIFYPRRALEFVIVLARWARLAARYQAIKKRIKRNPASLQYTDEALQPMAADQIDHFVEAFADKIPHTHGAPKQRAAVAG